MANQFPQGELRDALFSRLDTELSVPVVVQKQTEDTEPTPPYVMIETPESEPRGDIKQDTGHELTQRVRVHTRFPKGRADLSKRESIADSIHTTLEESLPISGHHLLDLPEPNVTPQNYEAGGQQAYDLLLDYPLLTQTL